MACPISYRLGASALRAAPRLRCSTLYAAGGLYGNPFALDAIEARAALESTPPTVVFNGDFNFFNAEPDWWRSLNTRIAERHLAMAGNVEVESCAEGPYEGCGCGYPGYVAQGVVERSDRIVEALAVAAHGAGAPGLVEWMRRLPRALIAELRQPDGERCTRVGIVHGDVESLSGWRLGVEAMSPPDETLRAALGCADEASAATYVAPTPLQTVLDWCDAADVAGLLCSHTCLPYGQVIARPPPGASRSVAVFNNGSAGMPNFAGEAGTGLITRVSVDLRPPADSLYGGVAGGLRYDALPVRYDHAQWAELFDRRWPAGSDAHASYHGRIHHGPSAFTPQHAARDGTELSVGGGGTRVGEEEDSEAFEHWTDELHLVHRRGGRG